MCELQVISVPACSAEVLCASKAKDLKQQVQIRGHTTCGRKTKVENIGFSGSHLSRFKEATWGREIE